MKENETWWRVGSLGRNEENTNGKYVDKRKRQKKKSLKYILTV